MRKVGQISFVNVAPFFYFWRDPGLEFIKGPPRFLGQLAREGKIDLAPLPIYDCFVLEGSYEPLGKFGIAATRNVMSVFLFSKKRIENLNDAVVSLTTESSTSVALLKLLFRERYRLEGVTFSDDSPDASLLIGDKALIESRLTGKWPYIYDLAQLWNDWTSLPFTFARWVVKKTLPAEEKETLSRALSRNLDQADSRLEEICTGESTRTGISRDTLLEYLRNFTFRLGRDEEKGIEFFRNKVKAIGLLSV